MLYWTGFVVPGFKSPGAGFPSRAIQALISTNTPLADIAYQIGFDDQSHFTRIFKRYTGFPPGLYREAVF